GQKESGVLEAEEYIKLNGDSGKVAIISGLTGADNAMQRVAGMKEVLDKYPNIEIVATEYCDWDTQKAQTAAENILTAHPDLKAFLVADDGMSKGVWNAIEAAQKQETCKIASQGFYEWSKEYIKNDKFMFTITYPAGFFSRDAMDVIKAVVDGQSVEHVKYLGMELVTKANVDTAAHD
ncbi:MAG: sugar ABC transporter substrate-binding protein, partial [Ruminococcaceae bacterium]|nr:sugar ABC transporter substrate-binding protein [Oscillospiraceae bacterium]